MTDLEIRLIPYGTFYKADGTSEPAYAVGIKETSEALTAEQVFDTVDSIRKEHPNKDIEVYYKNIRNPNIALFTRIGFEVSRLNWSGVTLTLSEDADLHPYDAEAEPFIVYHLWSVPNNQKAEPYSMGRFIDEYSLFSYLSSCVRGVYKPDHSCYTTMDEAIKYLLKELEGQLDTKLDLAKLIW